MKAFIQTLFLALLLVLLFGNCLVFRYITNFLFSIMQVLGSCFVYSH